MTAFALARAARRARHLAKDSLRRVVPYGKHDDDTYAWGVRSWSREDLVHEVTINRFTGETRCTCEDGMYRRNPAHPPITGSVCKHARQVMRQVRHLAGERF